MLIASTWGNRILAQAAHEKNLHNLEAIGQACRQYYLSLGQWPLNLSDLQPRFLDSSLKLEDYSLDLKPNILTISISTDSLTVLKPTQLS